MTKHKKIIAIQGDPIHLLNKKTDTTLLLALEAQRRGYKIYYYETKNLTFLKNSVYALCKEVKFYENKKVFYSIKRTKTVITGSLISMSDWVTIIVFRLSR